MELWEAGIGRLITSTKIPGLSLFWVREGVARLGSFGSRSIDGAEPVDDETVFEAASLSKPIVANLTLQLVDAGTLDLDAPLSDLIGPIVADDPASAGISARHVLSHSTGLPNWRSAALPPRTYFAPGSRFSYSGEGFTFLQAAIERATGEPLETVAKRLVFDPLHMNRSSFVWRKAYEHDFALPHDAMGRRLSKFKPATANAAFSLHTTAAEYGRFITGAMDEALSVGTTSRRLMTPTIEVPAGRFEALEPSRPAIDPEVAWGLGWGLEPLSETFFHWGANPGMTAFAMGMPSERSAMIVMTNSDLGLSIVPKIVEALLPGRHPSLSWLGLSAE